MRKNKKIHVENNLSPTVFDKVEVDEMKNMLVRMLTAKRRYEILDRLSN